MNNWQPINTAPKDRRILLAYDNQGAVSGFYDKRRKLFVGDKYFGQFTKTIKANQPIAWQELPIFDGVIENV